MKSIEKMNKSQEGTEKTIEEKDEKDQIYGESSLSLGKRTMEMETMIKYPHKGQTPDCRVQISFRSRHMSGHRKVSGYESASLLSPYKPKARHILPSAADLRL